MLRVVRSNATQLAGALRRPPLPCCSTSVSAGLMKRATAIGFNQQSNSLSTFKEIIASKGTPEQLAKRLPLTKIVATIGPASEQLTMLTHVVKAGMRIMRINFSHATYEEADLRVRNLNKCFGINHPEGVSGNNFANMRAVMLDTQGPEIRLGEFGSSVANRSVEFRKGDKVTLTTDASARLEQTAQRLWVSYPQLATTVRVGSTVLLDDGAVELRVLQIERAEGDSGSAEVLCEVMNTGVIGNRKGVNLPGLSVQLPAMSDKDKEDIRWGIKNNVDMIAASFVRKASDVQEIRAYTAQLMAELNPPPSSSSSSSSAAVSGPGGYPHSRPLPLIISKIESVEALQNFDSILHESDAIMVARGDLAVEIPMETLANVQKEIVNRCNAAGKPVIVATQMLESMQKNPRPTRAECTDVANALVDGADCVMLSGESAKGKYPAESVGLMKRIIDQAELGIHETAALVSRPVPDLGASSEEAMAYAAVQLAHSLRHDPHFAAIVVTMSSAVSRSVDLAKHVSKFRPEVPIVCVVPNHKTGRQLQLFRGLHPVLMLPETDRHDDQQVLQHLRKLGIVKAKNKVLLLHQHSAASHEVSMNLRSA